MTHRRGLSRFAFILVVGTMLSGCALFDGEVFNESFWSSSPFKKNEQAELGIAELAKGNYVTADSYFQSALKANPRDVHALLGAGILYQNTGQFVRAREMYEAVLAARPEDSEQFVVWSKIATRPASQIASVNLSLLETSGRTQAAVTSASSPTSIGGAPTGDVLLGRASSQIASAPAPMTSMQSGLSSLSTPIEAGKFTGRDVNIVSRFATIKALRDQGLVTEQEYQQRRSSNVGALLPLTSPPPAAGLDRPVPSTEQISARIQAISRALEMRAISVSQHAAERSVILDALMSAAPVVVADPAAPPSDLLQAADTVRRLELLKDGGYITSDEYARERQAVELAVRPAPTNASAPVQASAGTPAQMAKKEMPKASGPQPAVHLASYRSAKQAENGWKQIMRAHGNLLSQLEHEVSRVKLGSKGTYFRLKAGPLQSVTDAKSLCNKLKRRRQFCDTTVMNDG